MTNFQTVIDKIMSDESFRESLVEAPEDTLREIGVEPTAEMLEALEDLDQEAMKALAENFNEDRAAC
jgi:hypothetical protein